MILLSFNVGAVNIVAIDDKFKQISWDSPKRHDIFKTIEALNDGNPPVLFSNSVLADIQAKRQAKRLIDKYIKRMNKEDIHAIVSLHDLNVSVILYRNDFRIKVLAIINPKSHKKVLTELVRR